jgi:hypothetical protein
MLWATLDYNILKTVLLRYIFIFFHLYTFYIFYLKTKMSDVLEVISISSKDTSVTAKVTPEFVLS